MHTFICHITRKQSSQLIYNIALLVYILKRREVIKGITNIQHISNNIHLYNIFRFKKKNLFSLQALDGIT